MRIEKDSMGSMEVPDNALYGAQTMRAVLNFPISSIRFCRDFIKALGIIKKSAALANMELDLLAKDKGEAIITAANEVIKGELDEHFVVDVFQTGSGTSTNMNANEVIANRAIQILGGQLGDKTVIHPNDDVNKSQSSNDVIPTAMNIVSYTLSSQKLLPALELLKDTLEIKSKEFQDIIKSGRTHLQDATPITLGQEFSGYAKQIEYGINRVRAVFPRIKELALGGTAVGTGLNTHPEFAQKAIQYINRETNLDFAEASNHFEAQAGRDSIVELSGALKVIAVSLMKISNDIRWLSSGPRCGIGEIKLPEIQPGSSIMPAKVNPVICESVMMVCAQVIGNDSTITICGQHGNFELNVMMPIMAYNIIESIKILSSSAENFVNKCIRGIVADKDKCLYYAEHSLATCTALARVIGYDKAAEVAKRAYKEGKTVRQAAKELKVLPDKELDKVLDLAAMTKPGV